MSRETFWSRRRAQVEAEEAAEAARRAAEEESREAAQVAEKTDEEILAEYGLPDPDSIKMGDDVTGFMQKAIPERLRRRALRGLWRSNPVLACLDGLNDYDGDFTNAATDAPGVATAYRVGKGLLKHVEALEAEARRKDKEVIAATPAEVAPDEIAAVIPEEMQEKERAALASTTKVVVSPVSIGEKSEPPEPMPAQPRRMRFRFDTETE